MLRIASLHRYPVKSMLGAAVDSTEVDERGLAGDRRWAVIERETGLVASAKQPRKWGRLLQCTAAPTADGGVVVRLPTGESITSGDPAADGVLSAFVGRDVTLSAVPPADPHLERLWPAVEGLAPADVIAQAGSVTRMASAAAGTFFDYAPLHLVTTASLRALEARSARFRPNIVLDTPGEGFLENEWADHHLDLGNGVVVEVLTVTPRCAVPALAHGELPADLGVLRRVVGSNRITVGGGRFACVGVYARVISGGVLHTGADARLYGN